MPIIPKSQQRAEKQYELVMPPNEDSHDRLRIKRRFVTMFQKYRWYRLVVRIPNTSIVLLQEEHTNQVIETSVENIDWRDYPIPNSE